MKLSHMVAGSHDGQGIRDSSGEVVGKIQARTLDLGVVVVHRKKQNGWGLRRKKQPAGQGVHTTQ